MYFNATYNVMFEKKKKKQHIHIDVGYFVNSIVK